MIGREVTATIDDLDIYRAAKLLIDQHGEDASLYAAARAAVLTGEGDGGLLFGGRSWRRSRSYSGRDEPTRQSTSRRP